MKIVASLFTALVLWFTSAPPALAQGSNKFAAELTKVEAAEKRVTFKASMGQQTLRVAPAVAFDALKPGDKVLLTFGVEGSESIITSIEVVKP